MFNLFFFCISPFLGDKQGFKFGGVMSIFYTHFISCFCVFLCFFMINKYPNALNVHFYD